MASQRFIILINNIVIRDQDRNPIMEVQENGKIYFTNGKGENDLESQVTEAINQILVNEEEHPLKEVVKATEVLSRYNYDFKLKMYITPLYELQMQIASNPNATRIAGSNVDLQEIWSETMYEFYLEEFLKYTQIITFIETMVRKVRPANSPFRISSGDRRVMNVFHTKINGLFNPLDTVAGLKDTKLFSTIYGDGNALLDNITIDDPCIFPVDIMRGSVEAYFATSSDILKLCGIKHKEAVSTRDVYRLIAGIVLKNIGIERIKTINRDLFTFPTGKTYYSMVDKDTGTIDRNFMDIGAARAYADETGLELMTVNTDALFIKTAFPSFRNKLVTEETELLNEIRGADFVY